MTLPTQARRSSIGSGSRMATKAILAALVA